MKQMRQFLTTLVVVWTAACIATYIYSQQQNIPSWIALAVLPAFLVEFGFYLAPGFPRVRRAFEQLGSKPVRATFLSASAIIPYLIESFGTGTFHVSSLLALLALAIGVIALGLRRFGFAHGRTPRQIGRWFAGAQGGQIN